MKLTPIGSNQTQVHLGPDTVVLFSYQRPVAAVIDGKYYRTAEKWSATTSKHINAWLGSVKAETRDQSFFDDLAAF